MYRSWNVYLMSIRTRNEHDFIVQILPFRVNFAVQPCRWGTSRMQSEVASMHIPPSATAGHLILRPLSWHMEPNARGGLHFQAPQHKAETLTACIKVYPQAGRPCCRLTARNAGKLSGFTCTRHAPSQALPEDSHQLCHSPCLRLRCVQNSG